MNAETEFVNNDWVCKNCGGEVYNCGYGLLHKSNGLFKCEIKTGTSPNPMFMVFVEGGKNPVVRYEKYEQAREQAARLCKKENKKAYVLKDVASCQVFESPVTWEQISPIGDK